MVLRQPDTEIKYVKNGCPCSSKSECHYVQRVALLIKAAGDDRMGL